MITRTLAGVVIVLAVLAIWQRGSIHSAKRAESEAISKLGTVEAERDAFKASTEALAWQATKDREAMQGATKREQAAYAQRQQIQADADRTIAGFRAGELRIKARLSAATAKADAAGNPGAPESGTCAGLQREDAEFLVRLGADADQTVAQRNEAVKGWQACRTISEGGARL